jgi:predicted metalloprotease
VAGVRRALAFALLVLAFAAAGCGEGDGGTLRERAERIEQRIKEQRDRIRARIEEFIGKIEQAIPEARRTSPQVRSRGRTGEQTIDSFMTGVLENVDAYWTKTLRASGLPEPRVGFISIPPGRAAESACGPADDTAAFYCPVDDTIYVAQQFAADLWQGVARGLPGENAGFGHAAGDFGVAYVLAHEYAHNLQQEFGVFDSRVGASAQPFELQADCLAGAWGNSVYQEGLLEEGDVEEAINTALAVGDFDVGNAQHHGTPDQRREAWLLGFEGGDASACDRYVPAG